MPRRKSAGILLGLPVLALVLVAGAIWSFFTGAFNPRIPMESPASQVPVFPEQPGTLKERGILATVVVLDAYAPYIKAGDTMDVYVWDEQGVALQNFNLIEERVRVEPLGSTGNPLHDLVPHAVPLETLLAMPGLTPIAVRLYPNGRQAGVLAMARSGALLGLNWPREATYGQSPTAQDYSVTEGFCFVHYVVSGQRRPVQVDCADLKEPEIDPAQALIDQLKAADLAFNRPEVMAFGETVSVELVLAPETASKLDEVPADASIAEQAEAVGLSADLQGETRVVEDVRYAPQMQAELKGLDFDISPAGPQAKTVLPDQPVRWVWTVRPKAHGAHKVLTLNVDALLQQEGAALPPVEIRTFAERIDVTITPWKRVVVLASEIKVVHGALAALGGTLVAVGAWLWRRRKTAPKETKPMQVVVTHRTEDDAAH